jgi:hypothetical protein
MSWRGESGSGCCESNGGTCPGPEDIVQESREEGCYCVLKGVVTECQGCWNGIVKGVCKVFMKSSWLHQRSEVD